MNDDSTTTAANDIFPERIGAISCGKQGKFEDIGQCAHKGRFGIKIM